MSAFLKCGNRILHPKSHIRRNYFKNIWSDLSSHITVTLLLGLGTCTSPTKMIHQVTTLLIFTDSLLLLLAFGKSVSFERRASFPLLLFWDTLVMFSNPFLHITSRKMIWKLLKPQQFRHKPRSLPDHLCFHAGYVASPEQRCTKQFSSLELGKILGEIKRKII